jgi:hypothetical protein
MEDQIQLHYDASVFWLEKRSGVTMLRGNKSLNCYLSTQAIAVLPL